MSGRKGMKKLQPDQHSGRARMWRVMRRRMVFSLDDLVIPLDGVNSNNAVKFIKNLTIHGIVRFDRWSGKRGKPGCCKVFRLIHNPGPVQPTICPTCKQPITTKVCAPVPPGEQPLQTGGAA
ncbi:MAG: hypothetical protein JJE30_06005 [Desulfuromonadales bacterium]|nr:hypothetical protein [Desulfuromonadales bacterium]